MDRPLSQAENLALDGIRRTDSARHGNISVERLRTLLQPVLEHHVVPRLMTAHLTPPAVSAKSVLPTPAVGPADVRALVDLSLHGEAHQALEFVMHLRDSGVRAESLYLDLLTPAARHIGALWEADHCDFVLVTLGLLRIQQAMYDLSPDFLGQGAEPTSRRVLVTPLPGSQHTFGAAMVSDFFRRDGWDVVSSHEFSRADVVRLVRKEWFDVLALSLSTPQQLALAAALVSEVRKGSSNRGILVMVGGPLALAVPDLAVRVGADLVTMDANEAVKAAGQAVPVNRVSQVG